MSFVLILEIVGSILYWNFCCKLKVESCKLKVRDAIEL